MEYCEECGATEQGFIEDKDGNLICKVCEMENTKKSVDEDRWKDQD